METSVAKPRVNGSMLPKLIGHSVSVVGKNLGVSLVVALIFINTLS